MLVSLLINLLLVCQAELCGLGTEASSGGFVAAWQEETLLAAFVAAKDIYCWAHVQLRSILIQEIKYSVTTGISWTFEQ